MASKQNYPSGGVFNTVPPVLLDGTPSVLQLDSSGNLKVNIVAGGSGSNAAAGPTGSPVPADASYTGVNIGGVLFGVTGFNLPDSIPMSVAIVDANGDQITSFGGGTQYADDAASGATPTGTLSMGWDSAASKIRALKVDPSQNLLVDISNASIAVTQSTSPWVVSFSAPQHVIVDSGAVTVSGSVSVSNFPATQNVAITSPVDGSGYVEVDLVTALPVGSNLIGQVEVSDGTNVLFTSAHAGYVQFPSAQAVTLTSTTITGTVAVTQSTSPWVISGSISFTAPQHVIVDSGSVTVSGTVTANQGTAAALAGAWPTELTDGTHGPVSVLSLTDSKPLTVAIVDGSGDQITSFGGGTQYANNTAVATPTGTQVIAWDGSTVWAVSAAHLTNANALAVEIVDGLGNQITSFGGGTQYVDLSASGLAPTGTLAMGWDFTNAVIRAQRVDANQNLLVSVSSTSPIIDLLQTLILETRAMRTALVYMVTENQDTLTSDFDPGNKDFQPI